MKIILDTNFILTCVKEKVDFLDSDKYGELLLPKQVIQEIKKIEKKGERRNREDARLALKIIEKNKKELEIIDLGVHFVDVGIENYITGKEIGVATLDLKLKNRLKNKAKILTLKAKNKISWI